ncbi:MAG: DNA primase [Phycisphaeraceae bacterium]|nr:DNA primase [Phycisphaeraceae bacterium]
MPSPTAGPNDDKQRVLDATDIVRLVGEHVSLKKKGREWVGLCCFHDDHNPSMYVVPSKQIFHCFVCGAGGDALRFVMDYHKMGFREALTYLAERAGVALTPWKPAARPSGPSAEDAPAVSRDTILAANRAALEFFRVILRHPEHGKEARAFIERRGLTPAVVEQFQIGAAPDRWDGLLQTAQHKGMDLRPFVAAGLIKSRETGGHYDALRHRAIFPITDTLGRVIAFGGRRLREEDDPKYLNSPETVLFNKSATLYALGQASAAIRSSGVAVVTEGYMDAIACHQAGITNVVATLGTALTGQSARVLQRLCREVVLLFDGDDAGQRAADRAVEVFFSAALDVKIATLKGAGVTDAKDPDELLKSPNGKQRLERVLAEATDALTYRFDRLRQRTGSMGFSARAAAVEEEIARLSELGLGNLPPVRQEMIVRRVASLAGVETGVVRAAMRSAPTRRARESGVAVEGEGSEGGRSSKPRTSGELALACVVSDPSLLREAPEELVYLLAPEAFGDEVLKKVAAAVDGLRIMGQTLTTRSVLSGIDDPTVARCATGMAYEVTRMTSASSGSLRELFLDCLRKADAEHRLEAARGGPAGADAPSLAARLAAMAEAARGGGTAARRIPRPPPGVMGG